MTPKTLARSLASHPTGAAALMLGTALALTQVMPLAAQGRHSRSRS